MNWKTLLEILQRLKKHVVCAPPLEKSESVQPKYALFELGSCILSESQSIYQYEGIILIGTFNSQIIFYNEFNECTENLWLACECMNIKLERRN